MAEESRRDFEARLAAGASDIGGSAGQAAMIVTERGLSFYRIASSYGIPPSLELLGEEKKPLDRVVLKPVKEPVPGDGPAILLYESEHV